MNQELANFWVPGDRDPSTGLLIQSDSGDVKIDLFGCLEPDVLTTPTSGGYSRPIPDDGRIKHEMVRGVTRGNRAFTVAGVRGRAESNFLIMNGLASFDLSGHSTLFGDYLVYDWQADELPTFDAIEFEIPCLIDVTGRSGRWRPFGPLHSVGGFVGTVIPPLSEWIMTTANEERVSFRQEIHNGVTEKMIVTVARTGRCQIDGVLSTMEAIRSFVEMATSSHQQLQRITGVIHGDRSSRFPITHPIQGPPAQENFNSHRNIRIGFQDLIDLTPCSDIQQIAQTIETDDPKRTQLINSWLQWCSHQPNSIALRKFLSHIHNPTAPEDLARETVGLLEFLADNSGRTESGARVMPIESDLVKRRREAATAVRSDPNLDEEVKSWACGQLANGAANKGMARKLTELLDSCPAFSNVLLEDETGAARPASWWGREFTGSRSAQSHGVASHDEGTQFFGQRARLFVLALILKEIDIDDQKVRNLLTSLDRA